MADKGSATKVKTVTLSAGAADTLTITGCSQGVVRITNRSITNPVFFRFGSGGNDFPAAPTADGDGCYYVAAPATADVDCPFKEFSWSAPTLKLSLFCAGANKITVESIPGTQ